MTDYTRKVVNVKKALEQEDLLDYGFEHRDKTTVEVKFDYFIQEGSKKNNYSVTGYIFIPKALKVNKETYSKVKFYRDFQGFIRFQTPIFPIKAIANPKNGLSPLNRIRDLLQAFVNGTGGRNEIHELEYELKMLAQIFRSNLRNQVIFLVDLISRDDTVEIIVDSVSEILEAIDDVQVAFLSLERLIYTMQLPEHLRACYRAADEYMSYYIEHYLTILHGRLERDAMFTQVLPDLQEMVFTQQDRRKRLKYNLVIGDAWKGWDGASTKLVGDSTDSGTPGDSGAARDVEDKNDNAAGVPVSTVNHHARRDPSKFQYWKSTLKQYIKSVLDLEIIRSKSMARYRQAIAVVGAAVAMAVSVLTGFLLELYLPNTSLPFILAVMVAYALKDRIKSSINSSGEKMLRRWFPDEKYEIQDPLTGQEIGRCKESMAFITREQVPQEVMDIRNKDRHSILEREAGNEEIIKYRKGIKLYARKILQLHERHKNINDILHINIQNFLNYGLDPEERVPYLDRQQRVIKDVPVPVMYHLNIILQLQYKTGDDGVKTQFKRIRIVFNKQGIQDVEEINT
ncbi:hypothetical protein GF325_12380 [Candidatus Bathyarchaeota archaeon]|nr:hypothetical protein [Candidatus Bathyarchaeota archaeon]